MYVVFVFFVINVSFRNSNDTQQPFLLQEKQWNRLFVFLHPPPTYHKLGLYILLCLTQHNLKDHYFT